MLDFNQLSYWEKETYFNRTDYLVAGSGIVGLSTAIHLKQRDQTKKVTVLERGYLPTGASTKNAGFSCIGSPSELMDDLTKNDLDDVLKTVEKRWKGLNYLRTLLSDQEIGYQTYGSYEIFNSKEEKVYVKCIESLPFLNRHLTEITGIETVFKNDDSICKNAQFNEFEKAISHAAEGQINTGKMMQSLILKAQSLGIIILNGITIEKIESRKVYTNYGQIGFEKLAICTNGLARAFLSEEDIIPVRAQVVVTSEIEKLPFKGIFHFDKGYYYFRNIGKRVLFGGGRNLDFEAEETAELTTSTLIIDHLSTILNDLLLPKQTFKIEHQWAGTMGVGKSKTPIIKQIDRTVFCGVRLGGMGIAIGSLVGKELATLIVES